MTGPIKVFFVDDHRLFTLGIQALIEEEHALEVIGEAHNADDAMKKMLISPPDVLVTDISLPIKSGFDLARMVVDKLPKVKILFLSMFEEQEYILKAIESGAKGYISKSARKLELVEAIKQLYSGATYFSSSITQNLQKSYVSQKEVTAIAESNSTTLLTNRETEILRMVAEGNTSREIGERLFISTRTVDNHRYNMIKKLQVKNTAGLIRLASEQKIL